VAAWGVVLVDGASKTKDMVVGADVFVKRESTG